jgi:AraC-like DNA-binding protein
MYIEDIGKSINFQLKNIAFLRFDQQSEYSNVISPFSRLYLVEEGQGYLFFDGQKTTLEPNHLYLIPGFTPCSYLFGEHLAHIYIHFGIEMPSGLNLFHLFRVVPKVKADGDDLTLFKKCLEINPGLALPHHDPRVYQSKPWINKSVNYPSLSHYLETTAIISQLFSRFVREERAGNMRNIGNQNCQNALSFIQKNLTRQISVDQLAEMSFTSRDHFSRVFKSITGIPPGEYIIRKRLEKAKMLLLTTNESLAGIIAQTGFRTTAYFCRIFKKYTSFTPEEYRKSRG